MNSIAFIFNNVTVYWSSIVTALAVVCAGLMTLSLRAYQGRELTSAALVTPLSVVLGLFLGRLVHWYCRYMQYGGLLSALTSLPGGFSLVGVFAGCLLAAALLRWLKKADSLPALLDCMAPAGMLGVAVGRLAALFTDACRGKLPLTDPALMRLPFAAASVNPASGQTEWRFACFFVQSLLAFGAFGVLWAFFRGNLRLRLKGDGKRDGNVFLLFLALWGAGEIVTDSARYDSLFLRSNGFVSLAQMAAALSLIFVLVVFSLRAVRADGLRGKHFALWGGALAALGGVGYMEYYVQRHGDRAALCYALMSLCLLGLLAVILLMFRAGVRTGGAHSRQSGRDGPGAQNQHSS